jgi:Zn-dependent protease with chaperone function
MIVAAIENFVIFHTALSLLAFALVVTVRATTRWAAAASPRVLSRAYGAAVVAPAAVAAWVVAAALVPPAWLPGSDVAAEHGSHHSVHLIQELTVGVEPFVAYLTVGLVSVGLAAVMLAMLRGHRRTAWAIRRLRVTGAPACDRDKLQILEQAARRHGVDVAVLRSDRPISFVTGVGRSTMAVSTGTLRALSAAQLAGLVEHELAHHERADNRLSFALRLVVALSLAAPLTRRLLHWRSEQVELLCDEIAATRTAAPLDIAEALVTLGRAVAPGRARAPRLATAGFIPDDRGALARRVRRLVELADHLPAAAVSLTPSRRSLATAVLLFGATLAGLAAWAPLAVHTATESVLGLLR